MALEVDYDLRGSAEKASGTRSNDGSAVIGADSCSDARRGTLAAGTDDGWFGRDGGGGGAN